MRLGFTLSTIASLLVTLFASNAFADDGKPAQKEEEDDYRGCDSDYCWDEHLEIAWEDRHLKGAGDKRSSVVW